MATLVAQQEKYQKISAENLENNRRHEEIINDAMANISTLKLEKDKLEERRNARKCKIEEIEGKLKSFSTELEGLEEQAVRFQFEAEKYGAVAERVQGWLIHIV